MWTLIVVEENKLEDVCRTCLWLFLFADKDDEKQVKNGDSTHVYAML